jgi:hypothetical protein
LECLWLIAYQLNVELPFMIQFLNLIFQLFDDSHTATIRSSLPENGQTATK